jgi:hypothetical protein
MNNIEAIFTDSVTERIINATMCVIGQTIPFPVTGPQLNRIFGCILLLKHKPIGQHGFSPRGRFVIKNVIKDCRPFNELPGFPHLILIQRVE